MSNPLFNQSNTSSITVIYDGECAFCISSLKWVKQRVLVSELAFQSADLSPFNLTREQCAKELHVIADGDLYKGAAAIAYLLGKRGNLGLALLIKGSGGLGRLGYRWIAAHRRSLVVRFMKSIFDRSNKNYLK